jgi:hypothetical protein
MLDSSPMNRREFNSNSVGNRRGIYLGMKRLGQICPDLAAFFADTVHEALVID